MMLRTDNEYCEMQQKERKTRPATIYPSLVARQPCSSWYHGAVEQDVSDTTWEKVVWVGLTFLARFFRSFRSFRVGLSFLVAKPD